jgi:hypothetical protein
MSISIEKLLNPDEIQRLGVGLMTEEQRKALTDLALRMFSLGQHVVADIDDIKYDGRLVILGDGTRWEVNSIDASTTDMWSTMDRVVVIDNEMFKLDDLEKVSVQQES